MTEHTIRFTLPAAYSLLPDRMASLSASAMLVAIGLQESRFMDRRQGRGGPARSFLQFEKAGVSGVLHHPSTSHLIANALVALRYERALDNVAFCHEIIEDNDTLAFVFGRLLLWTLPDELPTRNESAEGYRQYLESWRPGRPMPTSWPTLFTEAWNRVAGYVPPDTPIGPV